MRTATSDDIPHLAEVLGRAFQDDPVTSWIMPDPERRRRNLPAVYAMQLRTVFIAQQATQLAVRGGTIQAGALWNPPGKSKDSPLTQLRQLAGALRLAGRGFGRLMRINIALEHARPQQPHWYLAQLGTDPEAQGTGLGRVLVESRLARCDEAVEAAYLEASGSNVAYYERFGFVMTGEISVDAGPTVYSMLRQPN